MSHVCRITCADYPPVSQFHSLIRPDGCPVANTSINFSQRWRFQRNLQMLLVLRPKAMEWTSSPQSMIWYCRPASPLGSLGSCLQWDASISYCTSLLHTQKSRVKAWRQQWHPLVHVWQNMGPGCDPGWVPYYAVQFGSDLQGVTLFSYRTKVPYTHRQAGWKPASDSDRHMHQSGLRTALVQGSVMAWSCTLFSNRVGNCH